MRSERQTNEQRIWPVVSDNKKQSWLGGWWYFIQSGQGGPLWGGDTEQRPGGSEGESQADNGEQRVPDSWEQWAPSLWAAVCSEEHQRRTAGLRLEKAGQWDPVTTHSLKHTLSTSCELCSQGRNIKKQSQPCRKKHTHWRLRTQNHGRIPGGNERIMQNELKENVKESGEIPVAWEHLRRYRRKWKRSLTLKDSRSPIGLEKKGPVLFSTSTVPGT